LRSASSRTINKLATICADFVSRYVGGESRGASIAETVADQFVAAGAGARTGSTGFQVKHSAVYACLQIGVLAFRNVWNRDDPLLQSVEVDLHGDWSTWSTLRRCGSCRSLTFRATRGGCAFTATASRTASTASGRGFTRTRLSS
jgi:hypothetical protein